ncbi:Ig-like domain-containing protein [Deinococcus sonorensis]|uniref:Ig-like domain-containing protein n=2 Tax=Deinococcus sonorensis TaxID=309891 RepID=A0AAU7U870_9DEIO
MIACLSLGLMACGNTPTPTNVVAVQSVDITLEGNVVVLGGTLKANARVNGVAGGQQPAQTVLWSSSDDNIASVNSNGLITAHAVGTVTITATSTVPGYTSKSAQATVTVSAVAPTVFRFSFRPATSNDITPPGYTPENGLAYSAARGYGWVTEATARTPTPTPLDISVNARNRRGNPGVAVGLEERQYALIHLQCASICRDPKVSASAAWEYKVPNGNYTVTVGVGDADTSTFTSGPSEHVINVEGKALINKFVPSKENLFREATTTVEVSDGLLTIDAVGGTNTKINYVIISVVK